MKQKQSLKKLAFVLISCTDLLFQRKIPGKEVVFFYIFKILKQQFASTLLKDFKKQIISISKEQLRMTVSAVRLLAELHLEFVLGLFER